MRNLVGTAWRGASGGVFLVERVDQRGMAHGRWDSGVLWAEFVSALPRLYVEVDGGDQDEEDEEER